MKTIKGALWVKITDVLDHPANPRDLSNYEIENLVKVIRQHGFLVPLTVIEHTGNKYLITSGHRRKAAAIEAGMTEVPVVIKEGTADDGNDLDLLLSGQLDHEDFTPYEWGSFLYTCWVEDGRPPISDHLMETAQAVGKLTDRGALQSVLYAFEHMPLHVWQKVQDEKLSFSAVKNVAQWVKALELNKIHIVEDYGRKYIMESLLMKIERGLIKMSDLKMSSIPSVAPDAALISLITKPGVTLDKILEDLGYRGAENSKRTKNARNAISKARTTLDNIQPQDLTETEDAIRILKLAMSDVRRSKTRLSRMGFESPKDAVLGEVSEQVKSIVPKYMNDPRGFTARDINLEMPMYKSSSIDSYLRKLVDKGYLIVASDVKPRRYFVSEVWGS